MPKSVFERLNSIPLKTLVEKRTKRGETICLTDKSTLEEALRVLAENHILSAPVMDHGDKLQCLGMISVLNIASHVSRIADKNGSAQGATEEDVKNAVDLAKTKVTECVSFSTGDDYGVLLDSSSTEASATITAESAAMLMARAWHRIVVVDDDCKLVTTISQSDLIQEVDAILKEEAFAKLAATKVRDLGFKTAKVSSFQGDAKVLRAVHVIADRNISAVGVVDGDEKLRDSFEASDLRGLTANTMTDVLLPIDKFFQKYDAQRLRGIDTITEDATFGSVVKRLAERNEHGRSLHRLWLVDEERKPTGVISLTDVFRLIVGEEY